MFSVKANRSTTSTKPTIRQVQTTTFTVGRFDLPLFCIIFFLTVIGIIFTYSTTRFMSGFFYMDQYYLFQRHVVFSVLGMMVLLVISRLSLHAIKKIIFPAYICVVILLFMVHFWGYEISNAKKYLRIGDFSILNVSDIAVAFTILMITYILSIYKKGNKNTGVLLSIITLGITCFFLFINADINSVFFLGFTVLLVLIIYAPTSYVLWLSLLLLAPISYFFVLEQNSYIIGRLNAWSDAFSDRYGSGYQSIQSLFSIAKGGIFGIGLGNSFSYGRFLPGSYYDFAFSSLCLELGLVGGLLVLVFYLLFFWRSALVAIHSPDDFTHLITLSLSLFLIIRVLTHVFVTLGILPVISTTLPLISSSGSSMIIEFAMFGLILHVSRYSITQG